MTVAHVYRITFKHRNCTVKIKQDKYYLVSCMVNYRNANDNKLTSCSPQEEFAFTPAHCNASFNRLKHRNVYKRLETSQAM